MATKSEPNAQNSELVAEAHPSGARIEKMYQEHDRRQDEKEKGMHGETLRPSERPPSYSPTADKPEGERDESATSTPHRVDPESR